MDKIVIYQIFTRLFCNNKSELAYNGTIESNGCGKLNSFDNHILETIRKQGVTHIWFTGVIAHASRTDYSNNGIPTSHPATVKGNAGSPYAIRDYFDIDPDLAENVRCRMKEFTNLVERVHNNGMKFIMDFVPNHVAREYKSIKRPKKYDDLGENDNKNYRFDQDNNFYYMPGEKLAGAVDWDGYMEEPAKATGNDKFDASPNLFDWYETVKLNYGVDYSSHTTHFDPIPNTWLKMRDILLYWADKGIDGFRCDMAEMVPVEFWHWAIEKVKDKYPNIIFIAEIYNPGSYSSYINYGHFDYIYDKVGMYDTLRAVTTGSQSATAITSCWQNSGENGEKMLHFMENHDEQRIASDFFAGNGIKGRPAMVISACIDKCPVMFYAGQELGEKGMDNEGFSGIDGRSTIFDYWAPDTLSRWYKDGVLNDNHLTREEIDLKAFYSKLFNICCTEQSISNGLFFDLMYVNQDSPCFDTHKEYAFLRKHNDEMLLIVANFADKAQQSQVVIPEHAFSYLQIGNRGRVNAVELFTGQNVTIDLQPDSPINVHIPANGAIILKCKV